MRLVHDKPATAEKRGQGKHDASDEAMSIQIFAEVNDYDSLIMRAADKSRDVHSDIKYETLVTGLEGHL